MGKVSEEERDEEEGLCKGQLAVLIIYTGKILSRD